MSEPKSIPFHRRLAALRRAAGISQYELAKRSGVSKQSLSTLEKGKHVPSWETVRAIARGLGVSVADFDQTD
jgi:transcriptional regulator with XRE-family HTH domain